VASTSVESRAALRPADGSEPGPVPRPRRGRPWRLVGAVLVTGLLFSACSLHVSKHGINGNVFGHKFSGASGQLPAGFPSTVPVPDNSRVLVGGGADNDWDVSFAVTGTLATGTAAYQAKFRSAGYTVTTIQSESTPDTGAANPSPSTTVTLTGSVFTATNSQWKVDIESGTTSAAKNGPLKAGEFAVNITVTSAPSTSTPTT
jgi:hypothetical protein